MSNLVKFLLVTLPSSITQAIELQQDVEPVQFLVVAYRRYIQPRNHLFIGLPD
jgi:hypothetical protein